MASREETETVLMVSNSPAMWEACEEVDGIYLGLDDRGRRVYRIPADTVEIAVPAPRRAVARRG